MSGVKSLTCLLFVVLFSVTVQAEALIGHHSTIHRHTKRNDLETCTKGLASVTFNASPSLSNTTAAICYRAGYDYNVEDKITHASTSWAETSLQQTMMEDTRMSPLNILLTNANGIQTKKELSCTD
ncbi:hypothetical protein NDA11_004485 [Ustilago hordei]|nr:hypothetical protein NDA11_004485 [Ustilago hordei]